MKAPQNPEATFLAAMTASATHEVRNVLAIIKESGGLIGDLAHLSEKGRVVDMERVLRAVDRIEAQVKRGADLLTNLNRLSHALDHDVVAVDLAEEVEEMVFRGQRFARKKGQTVAAGEAGGGCRVSVNPLHLHMLLFGALELCSDGSPEGAAVTVEVRREGGASVVEYRGAPVKEDARSVDVTTPVDGRTNLEKLATALGAKVEELDEGSNIRILFP